MSARAVPFGGAALAVLVSRGSLSLKRKRGKKNTTKQENRQKKSEERPDVQICASPVKAGKVARSVVVAPQVRGAAVRCAMRVAGYPGD